MQRVGIQPLRDLQFLLLLARYIQIYEGWRCRDVFVRSLLVLVPEQMDSVVSVKFNPKDVSLVKGEDGNIRFVRQRLGIEEIILGANRSCRLVVQSNTSRGQVMSGTDSSNNLNTEDANLGSPELCYRRGCSSAAIGCRRRNNNGRHDLESNPQRTPLRAKACPPVLVMKRNTDLAFVGLIGLRMLERARCSIIS